MYAYDSVYFAAHTLLKLIYESNLAKAANLCAVALNNVSSLGVLGARHQQQAHGPGQHTSTLFRSPEFSLRRFLLCGG
jgi:hypothetical protein